MTIRNILLIDDDAFIREVYEEVLTDAGFLVTTATNGNEGLSFLQNGGYDAVLLDVMMPNLNGIEVLTKLQTMQPKIANGPVILLSNLAHDPIIQDGLKLGAVAFLIKSDITPETLVEYIKNLLNPIKSGLRAKA